MRDDMNPRKANDPGAKEALPGSTCSFNQSHEKTEASPLSHEGRTAPSDDIPAGRQIGKYEIQRQLGHGAFGAVYLAQDLLLDRPVAVKLARHGHQWNAAQLASFLAEARVIASLRHTHLVTAFDVGEWPTYGPFIAMEYVAGSTLAEALKDGPLAPAEAVRVIRQVADAVRCAHRKQILHRDLKPSNILLDEELSVRVTDFGLALREEEQHLYEGSYAGTPAYMSPEQSLGQVQWLDARSDIWSLGVILYECLSGRRPFTGSTAEKVREAVLHQHPKPLRQIDPSLPRELESLCARCLRRDPADRPATVDDFLQALDPITVRPTKVYVRLAASVLLVPALVAGGYWTSNHFGIALEPEMAAKSSSEPTDSAPDDPRPIVWDRDELGIYGYSSHDRTLSISTRFPFAFTLGSLAQSGTTSLATNVENFSSSGGAGIFWGLRAAPTPEQPARQICRGFVAIPIRPGILQIHIWETELIPTSGTAYPELRVTDDLFSRELAVASISSVHLSLELHENWPLTVYVNGRAVDVPLNQAAESPAGAGPAEYGVFGMSGQIRFVMTSPRL